MRAPAPAELLELCDRGDAASPAERALMLVAAADSGAGDPRHWPLGRVNQALLELRALVIDRRFEVLADCPHCAKVCESELDCLDLAAAGAPSAPPRLQRDGVEIAFRLPTTDDILAVAGSRHEPPMALLVQRLLPDQADPLRDGDLGEALAGAIAAADPLAHIELDLQCPHCRTRWTEPLHVIDLFWTELQQQATRLIHEIAHLARSFGWSETEILAMSARRRQRYLELLAA